MSDLVNRLRIQANAFSSSIFFYGLARPPSYVVWATPTHPSRSWAVGREIRPGCLKVVAYADSKFLADALAKRLRDD